MSEPPWMSMCLFIAIHFFSFVVVSAAQAQHLLSKAGALSCNVETKGAPIDSTNPQSARPELHVSTSDGRDIVVIGHYHGVQDAAPHELRDLKHLRLTERRLAAIRDNYRFKHQTVLEHYELDLEKIRKLLRSQKPGFLALELHPVDIEAQRKFGRELRAAILRNFRRQPLPVALAEQTLREVLLVQLGAVLFLELTEPRTIKGIEVVAAEDEGLMNFARTLMDRFNFEYNRAIVAILRSQTTEAEKVYIRLVDELSVIPYSDEAQMIDWFRSHLPPGLDLEDSIWLPSIKALAKFSAQSKEREAATFSKLLSLGKSGYLFIGALHVAGFQASMSNLCK